jgi:hypothetical protein
MILRAPLRMGSVVDFFPLSPETVLRRHRSLPTCAGLAAA